MRILGIDPGTTIIGYGLVETSGNNLRPLDFGVFKTVATETSNRISTIYDFFEKLLKKHKPDMAAIEKLFFFKNAKTITRVSETRGVLLFALEKSGGGRKKKNLPHAKKNRPNYNTH